jgi:SAM-dependent methyltransferase
LTHPGDRTGAERRRPLRAEPEPSTVLDVSSIRESVARARQRIPVLGDSALQSQTLESVAAAVNYHDWLTSLAVPHLGEHPLELGSGLGDYAQRWLDHGVSRITVSEADETRLAHLRERFAGDDRVAVRYLDVNEPGQAAHSAFVMFNVLEHIPDDVAFLTDLRARLAPGGTVLCFVPAHAWLHSRFDDRVGHCRRYRRSTLAEAFGAAGFEVDQLRHVNAPGAVAWLAGARLLGMSPSARSAGVYQRTVLPLAQKVEAGRELPFGQSLVAVARAAR